MHSNLGLPPEPHDPPGRATGTTKRLVLSIAEAADALGLSDDLVYDLTERGELPCLRFGRRKVIPRQAIDLVVQHALEHFDPVTVAGRLVGVDHDPPIGGHASPGATRHGRGRDDGGRKSSHPAG